MVVCCLLPTTFYLQLTVNKGIRLYCCCSSGYSRYDLNDLFFPFKNNLIFIEANKEQVGRGRDISYKRNVPHGDAIHALIARDNNLNLITFDEHFKELSDITTPLKPQNFL